MINYIDKFLNSITMYRLVLYALMLLTSYSIVLAFSGVLPYGGLSYVYSLVILAVVCYVSNIIFAKIFNAPTNEESWIITAFILYFLMFPSVTMADAVTAVLVALLAMASKYILNINKRHIFDPAAIAALAVSSASFLTVYLPGLEDFFDSGNVVWWVGTPVMLPLTLVVGFLVIRKIRKFEMFYAFIVGSIITTLILTFFVAQGSSTDLYSILGQILLSGPLIFFGAFMLTEPITMPQRRLVQILFGLFVGLLFTARYHIGPVYSTPELALVIGNIFAFTVSMKRRLVLTLKEKKLISKDTYEFSFSPDFPVSFHPGQYLEWTLPSQYSEDGKLIADMRGNRRFFTIASSPTEAEIKLGVKFYQPCSAFKQGLFDLKEGLVMVAGQLGGDFILPSDTTKKVVFIAGGIGVTPFRSMIKYLVDKKEKRDVTLIYSVKTEDEISYKDVFDQAEKEIGLKTVYLVGDFLTEDIVKKDIDSIFYLSGPSKMVENYKSLLLKMGVRRSCIMTDYFPGY